MKRNAANAVELKQSNSAAMLSALFYRSLSRAGLARELGLTRAAVSAHIEEMIAAGIVREMGSGEARRGRKPVLLDINPSYGCFGGLYLSRGGGKVGLADMKGNILGAHAFGAESLKSPEALLEEAAARLRRMVADAGYCEAGLLGVGVGIPGPVDSENGVVLTPPDFAHWHHFPLGESLQKYISQPVFVENNAAAQTLAEIRFGHGRDFGSFIYMVVDNGIGGGIVRERRRLAGVGGFGSELGHTSIHYNGRACPCGNRGCLEQYADIPTLLDDCFAPQAGVATWGQVVDRAEAGGKPFLAAMEKEADYLSAALVNFVNALEPQALVLGGDLRYRPRLIIEMVEARVKASMIMRDSRDIKVLSSGLSGDIEVLSAATVALDRYYA